MKDVFMDGDNCKISISFDPDLDKGRGHILKRIEHTDMKLSDFTVYEIAEALALYTAVNFCFHEVGDETDRCTVSC